MRVRATQAKHILNLMCAPRAHDKNPNIQRTRSQHALNNKQILVHALILSIHIIINNVPLGHKLTFSKEGKY